LNINKRRGKRKGGGRRKELTERGNILYRMEGAEKESERDQRRANMNMGKEGKKSGEKRR
jgi:hypothetical protein